MSPCCSTPIMDNGSRIKPSDSRKGRPISPIQATEQAALIR